MSPPTMQIPVRTVATTRSPTPGTRDTGPDRREHDRHHQQHGGVVGGGLAGVGAAHTTDSRTARRELAPLARTPADWQSSGACPLS